MVNTTLTPALTLSSTKESKVHDIDNFLQRPYEIGNFLWTRTAARGDVLATFRFPDQLLAQPALAAKTRNFFGLRAGVEFIVLVNKQQFQAGNLLISYLPNAKYNPSKVAMTNLSLTTRTGQLRTNLDLMDATKATLTVPYSSPFVYYNLLNGDGTIGDFTISVYSPLTDVADSGTVSIQILARFVKMDGQKMLEFPTGSNPFTFSRARALDTLIENFRGKPSLKDLSSLVAEGTALMEKIRSNEFTFQMNTENATVSNFKPRALPNMAVSNGQNNNSHIMSLFSSNVLPSVNMGENSKEEMAYKEVIQIPCYHDNFSISNEPSGTTVWTKQVTPLMPASTNTDGSLNVDYVYFHTQPYSKWRGSLIYRFRAVKTTFHSLRVRVWFSPASQSGDFIDKNAVYSKYIDLKDTNQFEYEVPYIWPKPFLNTRKAPQSLGTIGVDIVNQMVFPATVAPSIDVIVERSAGTDFTFDLPSTISAFPFDPTVRTLTSLPDVVKSAKVKQFSAERLEQKLDQLQANSDYIQNLANLQPQIKKYLKDNVANYKIAHVDLLDKLGKDEPITLQHVNLSNASLLKRIAYHDELRKKRSIQNQGGLKDLTQDGDVESNPGPVRVYSQRGLSSGMIGLFDPSPNLFLRPLKVTVFMSALGAGNVECEFSRSLLGNFQFACQNNSNNIAFFEYYILDDNVDLGFNMRGSNSGSVFLTAVYSDRFPTVPLGSVTISNTPLPVTGNFTVQEPLDVNVIESVPIDTRTTIVAPNPLPVSGQVNASVVSSIPLATNTTITSPLPLPVTGVLGSSDVNIIGSVPLTTNTTIVNPLPLPVTGVLGSSDVNIVGSVPLTTNTTIVNPLPVPVTGALVGNVSIVESIPLSVNSTIVSPLPVPVEGLGSDVNIIGSIPLAVNANITSPIPLPVSGGGGGGGVSSIVATTSVAPFHFQMNTEQDTLRSGYDDLTFHRPNASSRADHLCLGQSVSHVSDMIKRSSLFGKFDSATNPSALIQVLPHAFGIVQKTSDGAILQNACDLLSYYANSYAFARGGINLRVVSAPDFFYNVVLDPDNTFFDASSTFGVLSQQTASPTAAQQFQLNNPLQQIIKPSLEGFGEFSVPFYSDTYMYSISPSQTLNPNVATTDLQLPYTSIVMQPNGAYTNFALYRAACSDFEFSYLNGPPILLPVTS